VKSKKMVNSQQVKDESKQNQQSELYMLLKKAKIEIKEVRNQQREA